MAKPMEPLKMTFLPGDTLPHGGNNVFIEEGDTGNRRGWRPETERNDNVETSHWPVWKVPWASGPRPAVEQESGWNSAWLSRRRLVTCRPTGHGYEVTITETEWPNNPAGKPTISPEQLGLQIQ